MNENELNKIIGEFMGLTVYPSHAELIPQAIGHVRVDFLNYTKFVDEIIPVFEKLGGGFNIFINYPSCPHEVDHLDEITEELEYKMKTKYKDKNLAYICAEMAVREILKQQK